MSRGAAARALGRRAPRPRERLCAYGRYAARQGFKVRRQPGSVNIECEDDLWRHYALSKGWAEGYMMHDNSTCVHPPKPGEKLGAPPRLQRLLAPPFSPPRCPRSHSHRAQPPQARLAGAARTRGPSRAAWRRMTSTRLHSPRRACAAPPRAGRAAHPTPPFFAGVPLRQAVLHLRELRAVRRLPQAAPEGPRALGRLMRRVSRRVRCRPCRSSPLTPQRQKNASDAVLRRARADFA